MNNDKKNRNKFILIMLLFIGVPIIVFMGMLYYKNNPKSFDIEFDKNSNIKVESLSEYQVEQLSKLCKVWGYVKYYHPAVVSGSVNWDYELFRIMPKVIEAKDKETVDNVLYEWINKLGEFDTREGIEISEEQIAIKENTQWIYDKNYISNELSKLLIKLSNTNIEYREDAYTSYKDGEPFSNFKNEKAYSDMSYTDDGYKLLSLFRYWNIIEYYYPYRDIIGEDWNNILIRFIPRFIDCKEKQSYELTVLELTKTINDSHVIDSTNYILSRYYGELVAPLKLDIIDEKVVVVGKIGKYINDIKIGDIITKVDNNSIEDIIAERSKYISYSNEDTKIFSLLPYILRSSKESINITVERNGEYIVQSVKCYQYTNINLYEASGISNKIINNNIGYINLGLLRVTEVPSVMEKLKETDGIILDLRYYPANYTNYILLGAYFMPKENTFAGTAIADKRNPGRFVFDYNNKVGVDKEDYYKGKIIILINSFTISRSEYFTMAFKTAPDALVLGSNSVGADGDIVNFILPGGINTTMSGVGIYYLDGTSPQRTGIKPDIYVKPTIDGIKNGRDELLEKAIEIIK